MKELVTIGDLEFEIFINSEQIEQRVAELADDICLDFKDKNPLLIVILNGAFVFAADLVRNFDFACEVYFIKLSSYKGLDSTGDIIINKLEKIDVAKRDVIIVEDIIDTGTTMSKYIPLLQKDNPSSISLASLLLKRSAHKYPVKVKYGGFDIPDKFVVGYGLDYNGHGRNLKHIYQLKK